MNPNHNASTQSLPGDVTTPHQATTASKTNGDTSHNDNASNYSAATAKRSSSSSSILIPPAPMKQKLRRRKKAFLEGIRTKREQLRREPKPKTLVEDYFRVDMADIPTSSGILRRSKNNHHPHKTKQKAIVLPGALKYENDWARDSHDFFNLVVLVPITVLNIMNWNWDILLFRQPAFKHQATAGLAATFQYWLSVLSQSWTGDWFLVFFYTTTLYFLLDLIWILWVPHCVKSPMTILQHHVAVLLYILIPYYHPPVRWCMGACMWVEINTWLLIARRVFNKQGFPPWKITFSFFSVRIKVISILFYVSWISIRCFLYPLLMVPFYQAWNKWSIERHSQINILLPAVPLHACFCLLNFKWTYELMMSKIRYFRRRRLRRGSGGGANTNGSASYVSKGL